MIPSFLSPPLFWLGGGLCFQKWNAISVWKDGARGIPFFKLPPSHSPCLVFSLLPGRYPPSFMAKKEIQNWSRSLHSVKFHGIGPAVGLEWGARIPVKPVAEGFTVHTYVWLHCLWSVFRLILTQAILICGPSNADYYLVWTLVAMAPPCYEASS